MSEENPYRAEQLMREGMEEALVWRVVGPGRGFGVHSLTLYPERDFKDKKQAEMIAVMCNIAYAMGQKHRSRDMMEALGVSVDVSSGEMYLK